jgi:hypothetical protein
MRPALGQAKQHRASPPHRRHSSDTLPLDPLLERDGNASDGKPFEKVAAIQFDRRFRITLSRPASELERVV